ncbi:helix-turn-helix domain-containing protein [Luteibacter anthropi]|uniref:helix-turn-helix domain-containing protein n=1 Tax=Luteibacter anthropi TaxID=564369 RepID=UPI002032EB1B|nr:helix-turn-helix transcriptional regulator [Luteibacter anthropi]URX62052.1 helix-turn-helix domain-containing protein [Luteibacter anthropi]
MADEQDKKTLYRASHRIFAELLRDVRLRKGLTQMELVDALGMAQTYASEAERAIRRLDIVQMEEWCQVCGTTLLALIEEYEARKVDPAFAEPRETDGRKKANRSARLSPKS